MYDIYLRLDIVMHTFATIKLPFFKLDWTYVNIRLEH